MRSGRRHGLLRPCGERGHERRLYRVLDELDVLNADPAREHCHEPPVVVAEEVLDDAGAFY